MSFSPAMVIPKHPATPTKSVGDRFHPYDQELVGFYLKQKLLGCDEKELPIGEVDFCGFEPWELPGHSKIKSDDQVWYFFYKRVYLNKKQQSYKRTTESGYWKPTGQCRKVGKNGFGKKKTLVFYRKKPIEMKTEWIAHEYEVTPSPNQSKPSELVIIKLKKRTVEKSKRSKNENEKILTSNFENQIPNIITTNCAIDGREGHEFICSDFENQDCEEMTAMSTYAIGAAAGMTAMPTYAGGTIAEMTVMPTYTGGTTVGMTAMPTYEVGTTTEMTAMSTYTGVEMTAISTYDTISKMKMTAMPTYEMSAPSHSTAPMITMFDDIIETSQPVALSGEDQSSITVVGFEDGETTSTLEFEYQIQTSTNSIDDGREMTAMSTYNKGNPSCQMVSDGENQSSIIEFEGGGWSPSVTSFPSVTANDKDDWWNDLYSW